MKVKVKQYWREDGVKVSSHVRGGKSTQRKARRRAKSARKQYLARLKALVLFTIFWGAWVACQEANTPHKKIIQDTEAQVQEAVVDRVEPVAREVSLDQREQSAFDKLMTLESGYEAGRLNKSSLACGIGQSHPCTKMYPHATKEWIMANKVVVNGKWYLPNPDRQHEIDWAKEYIKNRYGTPTNALYFWQVTSVKQGGKHWY